VGRSVQLWLSGAARRETEAVHRCADSGSTSPAPLCAECASHRDSVSRVSVGSSGARSLGVSHTVTERCGLFRKRSLVAVGRVLALAQDEDSSGEKMWPAMLMRL
jgi:hypothetical protein